MVTEVEIDNYITNIRSAFTEYGNRLSRQQRLGDSDLYCNKINLMLLSAYIDCISDYFLQYPDDVVPDETNFFTRSQIRDIMQHINNICGTFYMLDLGGKKSEELAWNTYWSKQPEVLFFAETSDITDNKLYNRKLGSIDYLTVTGTPGNYDFQCPVTTTYINADTDNIWFKLDNTPRIVSSLELSSNDLQRTPIKYNDNSPYAIDAIMILNPMAVLSNNQINYLFKTFRLHPLWSDHWNDNGFIKGNRGLEQILWTPE